MSMEGIKKFSAILTEMQQARIELLGGDNEDIRLGQLLETAKESVKHDFVKLTAERRTNK